MLIRKGSSAASLVVLVAVHPQVLLGGPSESQHPVSTRHAPRRNAPASQTHCGSTQSKSGTVSGRQRRDESPRGTKDRLGVNDCTTARGQLSLSDLHTRVEERRTVDPVEVCSRESATGDGGQLVRAWMDVGRNAQLKQKLREGDRRSAALLDNRTEGGTHLRHRYGRMSRSALRKSERSLGSLGSGQTTARARESQRMCSSLSVQSVRVVQRMGNERGRRRNNPLAQRLLQAARTAIVACLACFVWAEYILEARRASTRVSQRIACGAPVTPGPGPQSPASSSASLSLLRAERASRGSSTERHARARAASRDDQQTAFPASAAPSPCYSST